MQFDPWETWISLSRLGSLAHTSTNGWRRSSRVESHGQLGPATNCSLQLGLDAACFSAVARKASKWIANHLRRWPANGAHGDRSAVRPGLRSLDGSLRDWAGGWQRELVLGLGPGRDGLRFRAVPLGELVDGLKSRGRIVLVRIRGDGARRARAGLVGTRGSPLTYALARSLPSTTALEEVAAS